MKSTIYSNFNISVPLKSLFIITLLVLIINSCKTELRESKDERLNFEQIVLISKNAPVSYTHFIVQDSMGEIIRDTLGPKMNFSKEGFTYLDSQNNIKTWKPKSKTIDTLKIPCFTDYLELSTNNPFTAIKESFLLKNGDTIIFTYKNKIPSAEITNREVNDIELNYNKFRLKKLYKNKYSNHQLIFYNIFLNENINDFEFNSINYYKKSLNDYRLEKGILDSLNGINVISNANYQYRLSALDVLMENDKKSKIIKKWIEKSSILDNKEVIQSYHEFDLSKTDSLMKFYFFRDYLSNISKYNLNFNTSNYGNSGGTFIDSRIRFDSIIHDKRFNQTAKNFLLFETYVSINKNYSVKDKEKYFKKLREQTTNNIQLKQYAKEFKLDFKLTDKLLLTSLNNENSTYNNLIEANRGKWLYIDFWASWCTQCRKTMSESRKLKEYFKNENVDFIYLSLNDNSGDWRKAIIKDSIQNNQHYFIKNGNTSKVIEELHIKAIPHYLIYNPRGELVNGYAKRPGKGAKEQLKQLVTVK